MKKTPPTTRASAASPEKDVGQTRKGKSIPSLPEIKTDVCALLEENGYIGLIFIDVKALFQIEKFFGKQHYDEILYAVAREVYSLKSSILRQNDILAINEPFGEHFMVFLSRKRDDSRLLDRDLEGIAHRIYVYLLERIGDIIYNDMRLLHPLQIGYAITIQNPMFRTQRSITRLIDEARKMSEFQGIQLSSKIRERLRTVILHENLRTVFQPIVNLFDEQEILGYEALSRGPLETEFEQVRTIFLLAEASDLLFELDRACRRVALLNYAALNPSTKLFLNVLPSFVHDPEFQALQIKQLAMQAQIAESDLVFEITEQHAIQGLESFYQALRAYRKQGISIAIDDAGTGYSSLDVIMRLQPDYIKLDLSCVRHIDSNDVKRDTAKALHSIAASMGATVIAEGIESKAELETLKDLGIIYGQGFFIARPSPRLAERLFQST